MTLLLALVIRGAPDVLQLKGVGGMDLVFLQGCPPGIAIVAGPTRRQLLNYKTDFVETIAQSVQNTHPLGVQITTGWVGVRYFFRFISHSPRSQL